MLDWHAFWRILELELVVAATVLGALCVWLVGRYAGEVTEPRYGVEAAQPPPAGPLAKIDRPAFVVGSEQEALDFARWGVELEEGDR